MDSITASTPAGKQRGLKMQEMLSQEEWNRNVGTENYPVSFLHEYAVGLIWDFLKHPDPRWRDSKAITGTVWDGLLVGVSQVVIPDSLQPIGGYIPDLALLDKDLRVVKVIEVIVSNEPNEKKIKALTERGVEVVQIKVRNEEELRNLIPMPTVHPRRWLRQLAPGESVRIGFRSISQDSADRKIDDLMESLAMASPSKRAEFLDFLKDITSLESLMPLRPDNPKRSVLYQSRKRDSGQ